MTAPFQVGGEVIPPYFIGRKGPLDDIILGIRTFSQNYLIIGPRRTGKSSLLRNIEKRLQKEKGLLVVNVNCMETTTYYELLTLITENLLDSFEKKYKIKGLLEIFKKCLSDTILNALRAIEEIGGSVENVFKGYVSFREKEIDEHELARKIFGFLIEFSKEKEVKILVIFDEFQKTADFNGYLYRLLKSRMDRAEGLRFIFSGSSLSVLQTVFLKPKSPLYLMATRIDINPIAEDVIKKYISKRLKQVNITIENNALDSICRLTSGIPFYFQKLGDICYRRTALKGNNTISNDDVISAFDDMVKEFSPEFETRFEQSYSPKQQRILKALATRDSMRVAEIARALGFSVNELGKDMKLLRDSLTIRRIERGRYELVDGVFKCWLSNGLS